MGVTDKPRLLFLCQTLPYPPDGGVWIRTYHILRLLSGVFDITALCFERTPMGSQNGSQLHRRGIEALSRFARVEVFPIPQRHSRVRFVPRPQHRQAPRHTTFRYESRAFANRLEAMLQSTRFDLVHVDSLDLADYLAACRDLPVICVHHDVTSMQLRRRAEIERAEWRRAYLRHQAQLTERCEREWCARVAMNVAVSADDAVALRRIAPGSTVAVVPNGVDVGEFRPDAGPGRGAAFVGGLHWFPNADALDHFAADVLPHVRAARPDLPVTWIGSATDEQQRQAFEQFGIRVSGYVHDVRPLMREAARYIVPLRAAARA
jgi:glycosyltransferase involved in cell wall biosynthesis